MYQQCCASKYFELHAPVQVTFLAKIEHWNLIIRSFGKESNDEFPVIQDGDYSLMMDSASLSNLVGFINCWIKI